MGGEKLRPALFDRGQSDLGERLDAHEPLDGEERFDYGAAAVTMAEHDLIGLNADQRAGLPQVFDQFGAALVAVQALIRSGLLGHVCLFIKGRDHRQAASRRAP